MNNYNELAVNFFSEIIEKYNFEVVFLDENEIVLVGKGFLIRIVMWREGVDLRYIILNEENRPVSYNLNHYTSPKCDSNDRDGLKPPESFHERIVYGLTIYSRGLMNHCDDILSGDKAWIKEFEKSKYCEKGGSRLGSTLQEQVEPLLKKQDN